MSTVTFDGGFADPVFASQDVFHAVMHAVSRPGTVATLGERAAGPAPLNAAASAILLTLADYDTPVWIEASDAMKDVAAWLTFHSGAPIAQEPSKASFVLLTEASDVAQWQTFAHGTMEYPDRSATLILPVRSINGGASLELTGPGIETSCTIAPAGLPEGFVGAMEANAARYPLGFDILLVCGAEAIALPRTTRIREV
ncbi:MULTISPECIES: phosphonate C-P lyase system protein PhnH [Agrobacterium]|uniref:Phosphonate C-P lyase system protein PhnH n=1 Tax=Agrobacterium rosae TaxID=1972867 RepID=A0AAE5RU69_9HYPH|nr:MULTISPECIES: phosphonate C-P lyase system protein PhnH [Agrobacterium]KAA3511656.1 phosphonate C-P lyase system protein PhnH [Agrobacterium rosae]KAA3518922.1 phosphonate C-P lyase system protein PhnH [Agrobacterium rosae]MBN7806745.1 phosphonate C-P lyase system protein PhnH [Agrobacterium rosae]MCM2435163.1 phosphonate C-P lyase system protein PhnH [Agrobacterium rosae]MDX8314199.1 phosphonate C-P lyase system protein PhnH [Agrobacterium rosae]